MKDEIKSIDLNKEFTLFNPKLSEIQYKTFLQIVGAMKKELQPRRIEIINKELGRFQGSENIEETKLAVALSILKDLIMQEWRIKIVEENVYLAPSKFINTDNKFYLRQQLQIERNSQLKNDSIKKFIYRMEKIKRYQGKELSIKNLIGGSEFIIQNLNNDAPIDEIIQPYIQIVDKGRCHYTGYKLSEIWRYFRYTWSIPYKSTPGRNIFYLIRDAAQPFHPIIGISALGNSVLQLTNRDNYIGWTLESIKSQLQPLSYESTEKKYINGNSKPRTMLKKTIFENEHDTQERIEMFSVKILESALKFIDCAIQDIYYRDLLDEDEINNPNPIILLKLESIVEKVKEQQFNNKRTSISDGVLKDTLSPLYVKKRASELIKLLQAKLDILTFVKDYSNPADALKRIISYKGGRAITTALQANRKTKIGSNIMEIIVCGSIPPYNELLGGKLVAMLMTSPTVIADYNMRYSNQISEIASRMKGKPVIRDSRLAFLGTTSLYHIGSSQYNRIKIPTPNGNIIYKKLGETEGYSSIFFSKNTTVLIDKMLILIDGGRKINNVFGEGTSPRMRLMRSGLSALGIPEKFIKHHTKRIIYGIELANNTKEFLNGYTEELEYFFPLNENNQSFTQEIINFWKSRWLTMRINKPEIIGRLNEFDENRVLVSNYITAKEDLT